MANLNLSCLHMLFFTFFLAAHAIQGKKSAPLYLYINNPSNTSFPTRGLFFSSMGLAGKGDSLSLLTTKSQHLLHLFYKIPDFLTETFLKQQSSNEAKMKRNSRRLMIGSTAPTCTYNECRGCKYKCRAEQVPVEGNDPINSAYHYKCVCHRP
ncbi:hypothetical protein Gotri_018485 [Gossypium trilobum]|uniref:Stomagen C-terminal domain-containing protein n=4 Tax=Gossypium TaxID=3633 RepID=A0A7J9JE15_9ROSI|nr:hypothetical protein [Gossypium trilobum]MBA0832178.1 hypothetical protein [Gossypium armourianum]